MYAQTVSDADLLRELFADWARGEFGRGVRLYAQNMYFTTEQPEGHYEGHGPAGVRRFMKQFLPVWESYSVTVERIDDLGGGRYIGSGTQHARGVESGTETDYPAHVAVRMEDGKITLLGFSFTREGALEALGVKSDP